MMTNKPRVWTMLKGAARYLTGTDATDAVQINRAERCLTCTGRVRYHVPMLGYHWFCGERFIERTGPSIPIDERTCGCLVLAEEPCPLSINGVQIVPAGKTTKRDESCPRGKW